jgi:hypothetical protein
MRDVHWQVDFLLHEEDWRSGTWRGQNLVATFMRPLALPCPASTWRRRWRQ